MGKEVHAMIAVHIDRVCVHIDRVWQHANEPDRIHYLIDGRRLYADRGEALFDVLAKHLEREL